MSLSLEAIDAKVNITMALQNGFLDVQRQSLDAFWVILMAMLVFFMQGGFALWESGTLRYKNVQNIISKNMLDVSIAGACFFVVGYGLAFGEGNFVGSTGFMEYLHPKFGNGVHFLLQWGYCATTVTIVSGAVAERIDHSAYALYSVFMSAVI